jgi:hypothetical protein
MVRNVLISRIAPVLEGYGLYKEGVKKTDRPLPLLVSHQPVVRGQPGNICFKYYPVPYKP